jgi:hypothetical protein
LEEKLIFMKVKKSGCRSATIAVKLLSIHRPPPSSIASAVLSFMNLLKDVKMLNFALNPMVAPGVSRNSLTATQFKIF